MPTSYPNEIEALTLLFENGLNFLHLRKPNYLLQNMIDFIGKIPEQFHEKIVIHNHFSLLEKFELKGIHLSYNDRLCYNNSREKSKYFRNIISTSCHSINELKENESKYQYTFLSPIFDSISKNNYCAKFTNNELFAAKSQGIISQKTIALGGIELDKIELTKKFGFGGIGIFGSLWQGNEEKNVEIILQKFIKIKEKCSM
jgi:thiamine-phosphate pyrophosphorylase